METREKLGDTGSATRRVADERRKHLHLRDLFAPACHAAFPLLEAPDVMGGIHSSSMLHVALHNAFPYLHRQDIPILVVAVTRVFCERG